MRAAGQRLQFDPRRTVARAFDDPVARFRRQSLFVDMHLLAARSGLFGERQVDFALRDIGDADDDRPIGLARAAVRKSLCEPGGGARGARDEQRARCVLVEPVDQLGTHGGIALQGAKQAVDMTVGLRSALRREAWRLVEHQRALVAVDNHRFGERDIGGRQRLFLARPRAGGRRGRHRHCDRLACLDPVRDIGLAPVDSQFARSCPARDQRVRRARPVPFEPAVEADAAIFFGDNGAVTAHAGSCRIMTIPTPHAAMPMMTDAPT